MNALTIDKTFTAILKAELKSLAEAKKRDDQVDEQRQRAWYKAQEDMKGLTRRAALTIRHLLAEPSSMRTALYKASQESSVCGCKFALKKFDWDPEEFKYRCVIAIASSVNPFEKGTRAEAEFADKLQIQVCRHDYIRGMDYFNETPVFCQDAKAIETLESLCTPTLAIHAIALAIAQPQVRK